MFERLLVRSLTLESDGVLAVELVDPQGRELPVLGARRPPRRAPARTG